MGPARGGLLRLHGSSLHVASRPSCTRCAEPGFAGSRIKYYAPVTRDALPASGAAGGPAVIQETNDPFVITDFAPQDEVPAEMTALTVYVVFSQPVVPLAKLGSVMQTSTIMKIAPSLKGVYRWYGTRMLAFEPVDRLEPLREYTVTVDPGLTSLGGKKLTGNTTFTFHSEYLRLLSIGFPDGRDPTQEVPPSVSQSIVVTFSAAVDPQTIGRSIEVRTDSASFPFTISRPDNPGPGQTADDLARMVVLRLKQLPPENAVVSVILKKGAIAKPGLFPVIWDQNIDFRTLTPFRFKDAERYSWGFPGGTGGDSNPVYLVFSHPVKKENLASRIRITPAIPVAESNLQFWNTTVKLNNLPFQFDTKYHVTLDPAIEDVYGRKLGQSASNELDLDIGNPFRYAYFPNEGVGMLESQFPKKFVWESQDLKEGSWGIGRIDDPYDFSMPLSPVDFSKFPVHTKHFEVVDFSRFLNSSGKGWIGAQWKLQEFRNRVEHPEEHSLSLQVTDLGLTVRYGYNKVVCLVSQLSTGAVVSGAKVTLNDSTKDIRSAFTDQTGVAVFDFPPGELIREFLARFTNRNDEKHLRIRVESADDRILFEPNFSHNSWHNGVWVTGIDDVEAPHAEVFLFSDRRIYRPGETITFRGIDRTLQLGRYSSYQGGYTLRLRQTDSREPALTVSDDTSASGGLWGTFTLPDTIKAGEYFMEYSHAGQPEKILQREPVTVSYFRRLLFAASLASPDRAFFLGDALSFGLKAEYLSGGAVGGAAYQGYWTKEPAYFQPNGSRWDSYIFGPTGDWEISDTRTTLSTVTGSLSSLGQAQVQQATTKEGILGQAYAYRLQLNVTDTASSQLVGVVHGVLVHPADFYIGGKLSPGGRRYGLVEKKQPVTLDMALVRPDGRVYTPDQEVQVDVHRIEWKLAQQQGVEDMVNTRWQRIETPVSSATVDCANGAAQWKFTPDATGSYSISLKAVDASGRTAVTTLGLYVTGSDWVRWYSEGADDITLVPDKNLYAAGDTAHLLMQSPIPAGTYLLTIEREGILDEKVLTVKGSTQVIDVSIKEEYLPIVYVALSSYSVRHGPPTNTYATKDLDKPKGLFGVVALPVESRLKRIDLEVVPSKPIYRPGTDAEILIRAKNKDMPLAGAEITFMVVDRGVVDLVDYHVPDPVAFFYNPDKFPLAVYGADSRSLLIDPVTYQVKDLHGGDAEDSKIPERKDFRPTAYFQPSLITDANGEVHVRFKLPDSLTTFRCTALAVKGDLLGISEQDLKVQNPINVKTFLPRTMRVRDTAQSGVIVTNLGETSQKVTIKCTSDILTVAGDSAKTVTIPAQSTVSVPFDLAAEKEGTGQIVFTLSSAPLTERLRESFEVEQPSVFESVATIGKVLSSKPPEGMVQSLLDKVLKRAPANTAPDVQEEGIVLPSATPDGTGQVKVTLDSTRVSTLDDAFWYVFNYPYGCLEQISSRLLPLVAFGRYISAYGIQSRVVDVQKTVQDSLSYLAGYQLPGGGFPMWPDQTVPSYYVSLRVAHIFFLARENNYRAPALNEDALFSYLDKQAGQLAGDDYLQAYRVYVEALYRRVNVSQVDAMLRANHELGLSAYGMAGLAYAALGDRGKAASMLQRMKGYVRPNTRSLDITEPSHEKRWYDWDSDITSLSLFLMLSQKLDPRSDMIQRAINTLYGMQTAGYWHNTVDTNWALQALAEVIRSEESERPDFQAHVLLGGKTMFDKHLTGAKANNQVLTWGLFSSELKGMPRDTILPLRFEKTGPGTLYYSAELRYAIPAELAVARDEGISVYTEIQTMDGDFVGDQPLEVGQVYHMKAFISTPKKRTQVAVRLPIPSGCEALDANLATSGTYGMDQQQAGSATEWDEDTAPTYREVLDNEVRFFIPQIYGGRTEVDFLFRAVIPGVYPTPPATAEQMYEPEVFGRDIGRLVVITKAQ